ncbi:BRCT domain-containing protein, partial [Mycena galericulata]
MTYRDQTHIKVLLPKWFDDSVEIGVSNLSTVDYEWPDPAVLHQRPDSPAKPMLSKQQLRSSMSPKKKALYQTASWDPSDLSRNIPASKSKDVWNGRRILLSTSLDLIRSRRKFVEEGIRKAHGVTVEYTSNNGDGDSEEELDLINECDILVTRYRAGPAFFKAWRTKKTIGTLSWLLHVQVMGVFSSPLDQILHFPIPRGAVEGFDKHIISITNYTGESRDYLKKLITLMGGNFTPSLSNKNTVLIAAQKSGPKTDKAADWSITVVNHTWLEDCFLRWQSLTPALHRYISYPAGIDFANILGERGLGKDIEDIVAAEAETEGEDIEEDAPPHDSQASADESEVMGGLMPSMDVD